MPGDNCAVFGCGSSRRTKGIGIWKLPAAKDEPHKKWRDVWLSEITKTREIDHEFRKRIENDKVFTCEKHFDVEDFEICKYGYDRSLTVEIEDMLSLAISYMVLFIYGLCEIFFNDNFHLSCVLLYFHMQFKRRK